MAAMLFPGEMVPWPAVLSGLTPIYMTAQRLLLIVVLPFGRFFRLSVVSFLPSLFLFSSSFGFVFSPFMFPSFCLLALLSLLFFLHHFL